MSSLKGRWRKDELNECVLTLLHGFPETERVLFRQTHYPLCVAIPKKVRLFHTIDKRIVHDDAVRIQTDKILIWPVAEVHRQSPWDGLSDLIIVVWFAILP